jgi:hypothetical protein
MPLSRLGALGSRGDLCVRWAYGSWGGWRPSLAGYVTHVDGDQGRRDRLRMSFMLPILLTLAKDEAVCDLL